MARYLSACFENNCHTGNIFNLLCRRFIFLPSKMWMSLSCVSYCRLRRFLIYIWIVSVVYNSTLQNYTLNRTRVPLWTSFSFKKKFKLTSGDSGRKLWRKIFEQLVFWSYFWSLNLRLYCNYRQQSFIRMCYSTQSSTFISIFTIR